MALSRVLNDGVRPGVGLVGAVMFVVVRTVCGASTADLEFFEQRIRPVLVEHCHSCHSAGAAKLKAGLRLDARDHVLRGGESGAAVEPGHPESSRLVRALTYEDPDLQMPPKSRLPAAVVEDFRRWVQAGAPWSAEAVVASAGSAKGFDLAARRAGHWAWRPVQAPPVPGVRDGAWPANEVDHFLLARLEQAGLRPAADVDRATLLRRTAFALTGLPPSPEELAAFEADVAPRAFERRVDAMLASPRFGERWARHWLDKVRFAETMGHEFDYAILGAWRFRDYAIRAFNADVPYDVFLREQIAGDLVEPPRRNPVDGSNESRLGTMQYWLCQQTHSPVDVRNQQIDTLDNQIDVLTKSFLGLTVACARCHDHKFDAISTRDYYALYGILSSSRWALRALDDPAPRQRRAGELRAARETLRRELVDFLSATNPAPGGAAGGPIPGVSFQARPEDLRLSRDGWFPDGDAFELEAVAAGQLVWLGGSTVRVIPPGWWHSAALSRRYQGSLRSPTFTLEKDFVHVRLAGRGARFGLVLEGFPLLRSPIYGSLRQGVQDAEAHWVTLDVTMWKGRRAYLEFADLAEPDPASDLPGDTRQPDGWIAVGDVVFSTLRNPPTDSPVPIVDDARALARWRTAPETLDAAEVAWLNRRLAAQPPPVSWLRGWAAAEDGLGAPVLGAVMTDGTGADEPVFIRGNHRKTGEIVPRRFLEALAPVSTAVTFAAGSGRRQLAEAVTAPDNPLFGRVHVNWVWSHLFGQGLVRSVDNFGVLGERPSHPELLDWLAEDFRRNGYSTKALIRRLVLSRAWRMTSRALDPVAEQKDPDNVLWHRANLRRLEGEAIRDAMLAVSGRMDLREGGPSVPVHLTPFMEGRGRPGDSGPLDGAGRRSVYLEIRRNFLPPFLLAFDLPVPATTVGRRSVSNVPAQALALMNDPFVAEQARLWSARLWADGAADARDRLDAMYLASVARRPSDAERRLAEEFLQAASVQGSDAAGAWAELGHALFNSKEFIFVE